MFWRGVVAALVVALAVALHLSPLASATSTTSSTSASTASSTSASIEPPPLSSSDEKALHRVLSDEGVEEYKAFR